MILRVFLQGAQLHYLLENFSRANRIVQQIPNLLACAYDRLRGYVRTRRGITPAERAQAEQLAARGCCPICAKELGAPHELHGCGHTYCYYCLAEHCPALVIPIEEVPADKASQRSFRCKVRRSLIVMGLCICLGWAVDSIVSAFFMR